MEHSWSSPCETPMRKDPYMEIMLNLFSYRGMTLILGVTIKKIHTACLDLGSVLWFTNASQFRQLQKHISYSVPNF
jgi:hypothetical protein